LICINATGGASRDGGAAHTDGGFPMISDHQLRQEVLDELDFEPRINAAHIGVIAKDGVVTLNGFVASYAEKYAAEAAARRVKGVRAIAEEIEIRLANDKKQADDEIAERALRILHWDVLVPEDGIAVTVEKGVVTLRGTVDWHYQKSEAEYDVRKLSGVVRVVNELNLRSPGRTAEVKGQIEKALQRSAQIEAARITVETEGGKVILKGKVHDWYERDLIERAAWSVPGVTEVHDRLTLG
jgi:osmotically-inducible protein OsmY